MKDLPRAVVYLRVSSEMQAEQGTSLDAQEAACLRKAAEIGAQIIEIIGDEGVSGRLYLARPGIQKALALIESKEANCLIFMKLDRTGRDVDALRDIRRRVERAGGHLLFADGMNFENNATGDLMFTQLSGRTYFGRSFHEINVSDI